MRVAKVVIVDEKNQYLLMWRSDHPNYPNDPDIPGGIIEEGEEPIEAVIREVQEEAGFTLPEGEMKLIYKGSEYSKHGTEKGLFLAHINPRKGVKISWEHSGYEWVPREKFLELTKTAKDTYMHMVHDVISAL